MDRRNFLTQSALLTATTMLGSKLAVAAEEKKHVHKNDKAGTNLVDAANDCTKKGELCLQHCLDSLSTGSKTMAACAASVREMLVYCEALEKAAARKSKHLKAIAKIAMEACRDCEAECRKHKQMEVCVACAEACVACAKECESA